MKHVPENPSSGDEQLPGREKPILIAISIWKPNPNVTIVLASQLTLCLSVNLDLTRHYTSLQMLSMTDICRTTYH
jgi:hypothetical protein